MNAITEYRQKALEPHEFERLDRAACQAISFRERESHIVVWEMDEYGDRVQVRKPVPSGPELFRKGEIGEKLLASLQRPCRKVDIGVHLARLAAHKPWGRGEETWRIVVADMCNDLEDLSEYAIIKACEYFRHNPDLRFFPDTAMLLVRARDIDWQIKHLDAEKKAPEPPKQEAKVTSYRNTHKDKLRVARIVKAGMKKSEFRTKWEQRFLDAIERRGKLDHDPATGEVKC